MRAFFWFVLAMHGLIHLMGFAKAFGYAALPQLTQPITRSMGVVWLLAALLVLATTLAAFTFPRGVYVLGAAALVLSQIAIVNSWTDAKFGSLANALLLVAVVHAYLTEGPSSFRAAFARDEAHASAADATARPMAPLTEADFAHLPEPVRRYVRLTGFVGKPRIRDYRLRFRGRIRSGPEAAWMPFVADQHSFVDRPTRLFLMRARMYGLPVEAFHRLVDGHATMQVRAAGLVTIVDAHGEVMDRSEAVTLFNDLCILAPGALAEPSIAWESVDERTARARFTNGAQTITATLHFDERGYLRDFVSDDRSQASPDGKTFTRLRFSTPVRDYRDYAGHDGHHRIAAHGEARWHRPDGAFTYGEFELLDIAYGAGSP